MQKKETDITATLRTERERMLAGEPYDSRDPALLARYRLARQLLRDLASPEADDLEVKNRLLAQLLGHLGRNVWIELPFFCDYGENIHLGDGVFINYNCVLLDDNRIEIGDHVLIGPAVQIYTATHPLLAAERISGGQTGQAPYVTRTAPVRIGAHAWIGGGAILLPGVEIGARTTIGAGSVVTRSIPADVFAGGNPCRVIRELTPPRGISGEGNL